MDIHRQRFSPSTSWCSQFFLSKMWFILQIGSWVHQITRVFIKYNLTVKQEGQSDWLSRLLLCQFVKGVKYINTWRSWGQQRWKRHKTRGKFILPKGIVPGAGVANSSSFHDLWRCFLLTNYFLGLVCGKNHFCLYYRCWKVLLGALHDLT